MAVSLRPYQAAAVAEIRGAYQAGHRRVLFVLPTGMGKTVVFTHIAERAAIKGSRICILVHRQELVDQASRSLHAIGCNHGIIAAGYRQDLRQGVQVASVQTLARRLHTIPADFFQLLIVDEAHHAVAGTWAKVLAHYHRAHVLGVSATPERLSGEPLADQFEVLIEGPDAAWGTANDFLVPARIFAPPGIDLGGIKRFDTRKGQHDAEAILRQGQAMGDAVSHYRRTIEPVHNGTAIAFCCSVAHADAVAEAFRAQGITAARLDGSMDRGARRRLIADLGAGVVKVLTSCDIISEGTDIPSVTGAMLLRPTDSLGLHLQQVGRVLRPAPGKECLARGTLILTDRGLVPIERVTIDHRVWDGVEFVRHAGAVCKGRKAVLTHDGITATPDHLVMTANGWKPIEQAKAHGWRIVASGSAGRPVRVNQDLFSQSGRDILEPACRSHLQRLRMEWDGSLPQHAERAPRVSGLRTLQAPYQGASLALPAVPSAARSLSQPGQRWVQRLRSTRDPVSVRLPMGGCGMDCRAPWRSRIEECSNRQDRQQRPLRAGQPSLGVSTQEHAQHQEEHWRDRAFLAVQAGTSRSEVCRRDAEEALLSLHGRGNHRPVEQSILQAEREVWDILNAGPRNCFTANDRLVHNCAIINDHVGNTLRHGRPTDPRDWSLDGQPKRKRAASDALPIKVCDSCFSAIPSASPTCPECGHVFPQAARRELATVEGELQELPAGVIARQKRNDVARARTREELEVIRLERGYSRGWTDHILRARGNRHGARAFG